MASSTTTITTKLGLLACTSSAKGYTVTVFPDVTPYLINKRGDCFREGMEPNVQMQLFKIVKSFWLASSIQIQRCSHLWKLYKYFKVNKMMMIMMVATNNRTDKGTKRMEVEKLVINFLFLFFKGSFLYVIPVLWWLPIHF